MQYIPVEAFALLRRVHSHVPFDFMKMSAKDMEIVGRILAHFPVVLLQVLNNLHRVFGFVISQKFTKHCNKSAQLRILCQVLKEILVLDLLYSCSDEDCGFDIFAPESSGK